MSALSLYAGFGFPSRDRSNLAPPTLPLRCYLSGQLVFHSREGCHVQVSCMFPTHAFCLPTRVVHTSTHRSAAQLGSEVGLLVSVSLCSFTAETGQECNPSPDLHVLPTEALALPALTAQWHLTPQSSRAHSHTGPLLHPAEPGSVLPRLRHARHVCRMEAPEA